MNDVSDGIVARAYQAETRLQAMREYLNDELEHDLLVGPGARPSMGIAVWITEGEYDYTFTDRQMPGFEMGRRVEVDPMDVERWRLILTAYRDVQDQLARAYEIAPHPEG